MNAAIHMDAAVSASIESLKCRQIVDQMIIDGIPVAEIARFIQEDAQELTDIKLDSLRRKLNRYIGTRPLGVVRSLPEPLAKKIEEVSRSINALEEMERLYRIQMQRIDREIEIEGSLGIILPNICREVARAQGILNSILQMQMDLGMHKV